MNFHLELRKSNCRKELKRRTGRSLDILEVRRHELTAACSPKWAPCRIRYYPGVGRIYVTGPAGQHIGSLHSTRTLTRPVWQISVTSTLEVQGIGTLSRNPFRPAGVISSSRIVSFILFLLVLALFMLYTGVERG